MSAEEFGRGSDFRRQLLLSKPSQVLDMLEQARDFYHDLLTGFIAATRHVVASRKALQLSIRVCCYERSLIRLMIVSRRYLICFNSAVG